MKTVVISGSFHRHFDGIAKLIKKFESLGVGVLSPKDSRVINSGAEFVLLESDDTSNPQTLEQRHLDAIISADGFYLYNPEGYLGDSAKFELGWANALHKPIFCKEPVNDAVLKFFCGTVATPKQVYEALTNH